MQTLFFPFENPFRILFNPDTQKYHDTFLCLIHCAGHSVDLFNLGDLCHTFLRNVKIFLTEDFFNSYYALEMACKVFTEKSAYGLMGFPCK